MASRKKRKQVDQNLDSLMDILSNVVAVMILIAVVIVLHMKSTKLVLAMPIQSAPPAGSERLVFLCKDDCITQLNVSAIDAKILRLQNQYQAQTGSLPSVTRLKHLLDRHDTGDEAFRVQMETDREIRFVYRLRSHTAGESTSTILAGESSAFRDLLDQLDSQEHWVYLVAQPSGWETMLTAKQMLSKRGIAMGWDLFAESGEVVMTSNQRSKTGRDPDTQAK